MEKPQEILKLEKIYDLKLKFLEYDENIFEDSNTFKLNNKGQIIQINLSGNQIEKINLENFENLTHIK